MRIGNPAKVVLQRRLHDPVLEIRLAAEGVLQRILQNEFDERLQAFVAGSREVDLRCLPCWDEVRQVAGAGFATRRLYAQMLRSEGALLVACERRNDDFQETFGISLQQKS